MFQYRVTKYDPAHRVKGWYTRDEWISVSEIGNTFDGVVLTDAEYRRTEDAYVTSALEFMREAGVDALSVVGLENHDVVLAFADGAILQSSEYADVVRRLLREQFWCRLESPSGFVHVGYDYYMYVGVISQCPVAEQLAASLGLFVEAFRSPYNHLSESESNRKDEC